jgi:hypothetical protein
MSSSNSNGINVRDSGASSFVDPDQACSCPHLPRHPRTGTFFVAPIPMPETLVLFKQEVVKEDQSDDHDDDDKGPQSSDGTGISRGSTRGSGRGGGRAGAPRGSPPCLAPSSTAAAAAPIHPDDTLPDADGSGNRQKRQMARRANPRFVRGGAGRGAGHPRTHEQVDAEEDLPTASRLSVRTDLFKRKASSPTHDSSSASDGSGNRAASLSHDQMSAADTFEPFLVLLPRQGSGYPHDTPFPTFSMKKD